MSDTRKPDKVSQRIAKIAKDKVKTDDHPASGLAYLLAELLPKLGQTDADRIMAECATCVQLSLKMLQPKAPPAPPSKPLWKPGDS